MSWVCVYCGAILCHDSIYRAHLAEHLRTAPPVATVEACELDSCPRHYVVVRSDLPLGVLAAMVTHAAGESGPVPEHTRAVVLSVPDEASLKEVAKLCPQAVLGRGLILETEGPYAGQLMAIGLAVVKGRRPELSHLPILTETTFSSVARRTRPEAVLPDEE